MLLQNAFAAASVRHSRRNIVLLCASARKTGKDCMCHTSVSTTFPPIPGDQTLTHCANFLRHLSKELGNVTGIAALLGSAWDADVGLFRMTPEGTGDIQSSALALTVAEQVKILISKRCGEGEGCVCIYIYINKYMYIYTHTHQIIPRTK